MKLDSKLEHPIDSATVLVVEDDPALLRLIQKRLQQRGHKTAGVRSGTLALSWLANNHTRLMLLDYSLPDMPGEDLLQKLEERKLSVPFVVATGHGSETVAVDMMRCGAIDYLAKESSFLKLLPTVIDDALARIDQKDELNHRAALEELITTICADLVAVSNYEVDSGIDKILRTIGEFAKAQQGYVFLISECGTKAIRTHSWHSSGASLPPTEHKKLILEKQIPELSKKIRHFEPWRVVDVALLKNSKESRFCEIEQADSVLVIPIATGGNLIGFFGFNSVAEKWMWLDDDVALLQIVGKLLADALERKRAEDELRQAHNQLESRVQCRTNQLAEANAKLRLEMEERKHAEERLAQHQAELAHMNRLSMLAETVAELAHELNQPLSAIASHAQACVRLIEISNAAKGEYFKDAGVLLSSNRQISEQASRAGSIIRSLRNFVGKAKFKESYVNLNELIRDVIPLVEAEVQLSQFKVVFSLDENLSAAHVDRIQIEQVLVNLIHNAIDAMRGSDTDSSVLTISTCINNGIIVAVCDTGTGIREEDLERVFDRFFTTKPDRMGMGLPICRSIVENHGGRLWVTPNSGRGVTFQFTLPISYGDQ